MKRSMKDQTRIYYDEHACDLTKRYESVSSSRFLSGLIDMIPAGSKVLDLGCGSGRDAAYLLSEGFDVLGLDGSQSMLEEAMRSHPELSDRLIFQVLPGVLSFADDSLDAVVSIACLMHFDPVEIGQILSEIHRILNIKGLVLITVRRALSSSPALDEHGRYFTPISISDWEELFSCGGLRIEKITHEKDALGRSLTWTSFLLRKD